MIHGMDTGFLVAAEVAEHPEFAAARGTLSGLLGKGDRLALAPQVLAEFMHIVTDPRRFKQPVEIGEARRIARKWWTATDVDHVFPDAVATTQFLDLPGSVATREKAVTRHVVGRNLSSCRHSFSCERIGTISPYLRF